MHVLVTGANGLVGSALVPFLTTGGHRVSRLVRSTPRPGQAEILWHPETGSIATPALEDVDAVVHLAGENIATGRWTAEKKRKFAPAGSRVRACCAMLWHSSSTRPGS